MRKLDTKETSSRSFAVDEKAKTVTVVHTVKPDEKHQSRYELKWTFNFSDVTVSELMKLATRPILIKWQARWRAAADRMKGDVWDNRTFKVRDILDNARQAADPMAKAKSAAAKMSAEERAALIAELQAMDENE